MKNETLADKLFGSVLIALPALVLLLGLIPGFLPMYDGELARYVGCSLLSPPPDNVMTNLCPVILITGIYTLILTICYFRSQSLGTIKAIFVFSITCLVVTLLAFLPDRTVKPMPYGLLPILWTVMCIVAFVRMQLEIKRYDFD